ncbi:MAG TPA: hypothetical protein VFQ44_08810 [Streptosporangiaceae bacterium]|nr:hypothetical protein [Streptosporangiaceae bacterium]
MAVVDSRAARRRDLVPGYLGRAVGHGAGDHYLLAVPAHVHYLPSCSFGKSSSITPGLPAGAPVPIGTVRRRRLR